MSELERLWKRQAEYNQQIKTLAQKPYDSSFWTKEYVLGIVSEIDEVLREIDWKKNRPGSGQTNRENLAIEFADLTKYIMSLWQVWGFSVLDMLHFCHAKSEMLEFLFQQEFRSDFTNERILLTDLDGTIVDFRRGFLQWLTAVHPDVPQTVDQQQTMQMDCEMGWSLADYRQWKDEFESTGGYADLPPFLDGVAFVRQAQNMGWKIIVVTARPIEISHIWFESVTWLRKQGIVPDEFFLVGEERVEKALEYRERGNTVLVLDDDPKWLGRMTAAHIPCLVRAQEYNKDFRWGGDTCFYEPDFTPMQYLLQELGNG